jgi:hypothetical protein
VAAQLSEERLEEEVAAAIGLDPELLGEEEEALLADVEGAQPHAPRLGRAQYLKVPLTALTALTGALRRGVTGPLGLLGSCAWAAAARRTPALAAQRRWGTSAVE